MDPEAGDPDAGQTLGHLGGRRLAGVVAVEGEEHPLDLVSPEGLQVLLGEARRPVGRGDVAEAGRPEGQSVDQRLGEDDLLRLGQG